MRRKGGVCETETETESDSIQDTFLTRYAHVDKPQQEVEGGRGEDRSNMSLLFVSISLCLILSLCSSSLFLP